MEPAELCIARLSGQEEAHEARCVPFSNHWQPKMGI